MIVKDPNIRFIYIFLLVSKNNLVYTNTCWNCLQNKERNMYYVYMNIQKRRHNQNCTNEAWRQTFYIVHLKIK